MLSTALYKELSALSKINEYNRVVQPGYLGTLGQTNTNKMSKKYIEFDGFCPESKLKGEQVEMRLNEDDFWESVKTELQIAISDPYAVILKWRGKNQLRKSSPKASDMHYGLLLTESMDIKGEEISLYKEGLFEYENDLEDYIESIYDTEEEYNKNKFDPGDPVFKKQKKHLDNISKEKYLQLIKLIRKQNLNGIVVQSLVIFMRCFISFKLFLLSIGIHGLGKKNIK